LERLRGLITGLIVDIVEDAVSAYPKAIVLGALKDSRSAGGLSRMGFRANMASMPKAIWNGTVIAETERFELVEER